MRWSLACTGFLALAAVAVSTQVWIDHRSLPESKTTVAYLIRANASSRISRSWKTIELTTSWALHSDETIKIPAGSTVSAIHRNGLVETLKGPRELRLSAAVSDEIDPLASPLAAVADSMVVNDAPSPNSFVITTPVGLTRYINPVISWQALHGRKYDVAIRDPEDEFAPPRTLLGIRPPVRLSQLKTTDKPELRRDRQYVLLVRESGNNSVTALARFLTAPEATTDEDLSDPATLLTEAFLAMLKPPNRTGDAWVALSRLPPEWAQCELAIRLRMMVSVELGLRDDLARARVAARLLDSP